MPTGIEWCDETFNPWHGCEKVSPACAHCYAEGQSNRFNGAGMWGAGHGFRFQSDAYWARPLTWARTLTKKLGRRPRVFCASMADVFEERDELEEHRDRLYDLIAATPELDWLLLTKRPEFARDELRRFYGIEPETLEPDEPYPNIWVGVSIENARYTWRADVLREIPAAVRFISAEPLLGSLFEATPCTCPEDWTRYPFHHIDCKLLSRPRNERKEPLDLTGIDWVIAGGESGPKARPSHPDWFRELRDACLSMRGDRHDGPGNEPPAFFFKQWGEWRPGDWRADGFDDRGGEVSIDHSGREYDGTLQSFLSTTLVTKFGKKRAGRELDGRTWDEFPQSAAVPA